MVVFIILYVAFIIVVGVPAMAYFGNKGAEALSEIGKQLNKNENE